MMDRHGDGIYLPPFMVAENHAAKELAAFKHVLGECRYYVVGSRRSFLGQFELFQRLYVEANNRKNGRVFETFLDLCTHTRGGLGPGALEENGVLRRGALY